MTSSLGSINLLEWLTELSETFHLLDYQFIIKGYNSGTAKWKRCMGKGHDASIPSPKVVPLSHPSPVSSFSGFYRGFNAGIID